MVPVTVIVSEGVYAMAAEARFVPTRRKFTRTARLTIRAEILPDDTAWHFGRMPTLIHTMPLEPQWNHAMRHCIVYGCYQGGPWTAVVAGDLDFRNNIVAECRNAWVRTELGSVDADASAGVPGANGRPFRKDPPPTDGKYRIVDSLFAHNRRLAVSGTGSNLGFKDIDAGLFMRPA